MIKMVLKYLKRNKVEEFKNIKNNLIQHFIRQLLYRRFMIDNFNCLEDLENQLYHLYDQTININFLKTDGQFLLNKLSKLTITNTKKLDKIIISCDFSLEFISFCMFKQLEELNLSNTDITDNAGEYLISCNLEQLKLLNLSKTNISDKTIKKLINCDLKLLKGFYLSHTRITNKAIEYLIRCNFKKIREIDLDNTQVTKNSIKSLIMSDLKQLRIHKLLIKYILEPDILENVNLCIKFSFDLNEYFNFAIDKFTNIKNININFNTKDEIHFVEKLNLMIKNNQILNLSPIIFENIISCIITNIKIKNRILNQLNKISCKEILYFYKIFFREILDKILNLLNRDNILNILNSLIYFSNTKYQF